MLFAPPHYRVHANCRVCRGYGLYWLQCMGAPHVCHRSASVERKFFHRGKLNDCGSYWSAVFLLGGDDLEWAAAASIAHALDIRIFLRVLDRRIIGSHARFRTGGLAGTRYLFCSCSLPLCPHRRRSLSYVRRHLFLVSENHRTNGKRKTWNVAFLALLHRLQHHVFHIAFSRITRHAAPCLYLRP